MVLYEGKAVTFKHFYNFPSVAKSAGYDFNYFDTLSITTKIPGDLIIDLINWFRNFLDIEIRELPEYLIAFIVMVLGIPCYFITFPLVAWVVHYKLKTTNYNHSRHEILTVIYHYENK